MSAVGGGGGDYYYEEPPRPTPPPATTTTDTTTNLSLRALQSFVTVGFLVRLTCDPTKPQRILGKFELGSRAVSGIRNVANAFVGSLTVDVYQNTFLDNVYLDITGVPPTHFSAGPCNTDGKDTFSVIIPPHSARNFRRQLVDRKAELQTGEFRMFGEYTKESVLREATPVAGSSDYIVEWNGAYHTVLFNHTLYGGEPLVFINDQGNRQLNGRIVTMYTEGVNIQIKKTVYEAIRAFLLDTIDRLGAVDLRRISISGYDSAAVGSNPSLQGAAAAATTTTMMTTGDRQQQQQQQPFMEIFVTLEILRQSSSSSSSSASASASGDP